MSDGADEYPKRPPFYAYRLTRLMFKTALANEIGPEACHMIIQIAHTEDATRYCKAVRFYNEQLLPVCGFTNVKALDRARSKAVASGWLRYIPGGKGVSGKYWTTIPAKYADMEDKSIDESAAADELEPTEDQSEPVSLPATGKETGDKRETNGRQVPENRATIYPNPIPEECMYGADEDSKFVPISAICRDDRVTLLEVQGELKHYDECAIDWEAEFLRQFNAADGTHKRLEPLDYALRSELQKRLCQPGWYWRRALAAFPLKAEWFEATQNMTWFLRKGTVTAILDGTYHQKERPKGKTNGNSKSLRGGLGVNYDPDAASKDPDYGKF